MAETVGLTWRFDALADHFDVESFGPQGAFEARRRHRQEHVRSEMDSCRERLAAQSVETMAATMASDLGAQGPRADQPDLALSPM